MHENKDNVVMVTLFVLLFAYSCIMYKSHVVLPYINHPPLISEFSRPKSNKKCPNFHPYSPAKTAISSHLFAA